MKKLLLVSLFILGLWFALSNFKGLANQGSYESIIVNFRDNIEQASLEADLKAIATQYHKSPQLNSIFSAQDNVYVLEGDKNLLKNLKKSPVSQHIKYIEPNYIYHTLETPNDPSYSQQWNFSNINVEQAWDYSKGEGVTVAVIDTGVTKVPDLQKTKFVKGYDFVNDRVDARDDNGHGTHVAGTIAQSTNNNYGVAGVAYKAKIMPLKVLSRSGGGTVADIAEAIRFAADNNADVINMSLGGGGENKLMKEAIDYAYDKGVVIIAAAGNENRNAASYPARYPKVISVSALDSAGKKAPYSNYGAGVDISAPGGSETGKIIQETINARNGKSEFLGFQGTSMAAPHVAGVAALIKASGVKSPSEITEILKQSVHKVQEDPLNHYGAGQLDAGQAVKLSLKGKIILRDFFRWLRDHGYLNPIFWIDGGAIALLPKLGMVLGAYLLAWLLRNYLIFNLSLSAGLIFGSSGLFLLQGLYLFDLPQWPFRLMGSSIPELGNAVMATNLLNPIFASALIPFVLILLFLGHSNLKWFALGSSLGVVSCLIIHAILAPQVWGMSNEIIARSFLIINALICLGIAYLAMKGKNKLLVN